MARGGHHGGGHHGGSHHSGSHHSSFSSHSHSHSYHSHHHYGGYSSSSYRHTDDFRTYTDPSKPPMGVQDYHGTWYSGRTGEYHLNMNDDYVYDLYYNKSGIPVFVRDPATQRRTGSIISLLFMLGVMNIPYEALITIFENMVMTDEWFNLMDNLIYYGQVIFPVILTIIFLKMDSKKRKTCQEIARQTVSYYQHKAEQEQMLEERAKAKYYEKCPSCGGIPGPNDTICPYCGHSLEFYTT